MARGTQIRPTAFAGVHLHEKLVPLAEEVKYKVELTALDQAFIMYTPVASVRGRPSPAFFLWHGRPAGPTVIFTFAVGRPELFNTAKKTEKVYLEQFPWVAASRGTDNDLPDFDGTPPIHAGQLRKGGGENADRISFCHFRDRTNHWKSISADFTPPP